jgi:bifunctional DNA-binding transcriptional regulator/antitoxin component of YhaV-PrlF toxin-antitoxin module
MNVSIPTRLGAGRRIAIPAYLCERYGFSPGSPLILQAEADGIHIRQLEQVVREAQNRVSRYVPAGVSLAEALSKERAEAGRDE